MYVLLCPLKNEESEIPAKLINLDYFCNALAIAFAIDVFPVPGGPCSSNINPFDLACVFFI